MAEAIPVNGGISPVTEWRHLTFHWLQARPRDSEPNSDCGRRDYSSLAPGPGGPGTQPGPGSDYQGPGPPGSESAKLVASLLAAP